MSADVRPDRLRHARRLAASVAAVSVVFTALTGALMALQYAKTGFGKPPWSGDIEKTLARYDKGESTPEMRERLRRMDADLRLNYFGLRVFYARGAWMLAAGAVVTALCFRVLRDTEPIRPSVPQRGEASDGPNRGETRRARGALLIVAAALLGVCLVAWAMGTAASAPSQVAPMEATPGGR